MTISQFKRSFFAANFQLVQTGFAWLGGTAMILSMHWHGALAVCDFTRDAAELVLFSLCVALLYRIRFVFFFLLSVYFACAHALFMALLRPQPVLVANSTVDIVEAIEDDLIELSMYDFALVIFGFVLQNIINYYMEFSQRKDFISAVMTYKESKRSDFLLKNALPTHVINTLKSKYQPGISRGDRSLAEAFNNATILFADVVSFTTLSARVQPSQLVSLLNRMFICFDSLAEECGVEKIKTIGDCYMGAGGLPEPDVLHAHKVCRFGLQMLEAVQQFHDDQNNPIRIRAGAHSGPCVAGVIGLKKFTYDVWGDAVNTASRMESHGEPMRLHVSASTASLVADDFDCADRGTMTVKGKGEMHTFFVNSEKEGSQWRTSVSQQSSKRKTVANAPGVFAVSLDQHASWFQDGESDAAV